MSSTNIFDISNKDDYIIVEWPDKKAYIGTISKIISPTSIEITWFNPHENTSPLQFLPPNYILKTTDSTNKIIDINI